MKNLIITFAAIVTLAFAQSCTVCKKPLKESADNYPTFKVEVDTEGNTSTQVTFRLYVNGVQYARADGGLMITCRECKPVPQILKNRKSVTGYCVKIEGDLYVPMVINPDGTTSINATACTDCASDVVKAPSNGCATFVNSLKVDEVIYVYREINAEKRYISKGRFTDDPIGSKSIAFLPCSSFSSDEGCLSGLSLYTNENELVVEDFVKTSIEQKGYAEFRVTDVNGNMIRVIKN